MRRPVAASYRSTADSRLMLPKVFSRLAGKPAYTPATGASAVAPERPAATETLTPTPDPVPEPSAPPAVIAQVGPILGEPSIHDEVEAGSDVRRWLRTALATLEQEMDPSELKGDAQAFFERISRSGEKTVRQPPAAAQRALDLMRQDVAISALVRLVEQDPVLAQSLLRFANSAAYTTGGRSTSLSECIRRVGTQGLRSVILSSMVEGQLCRSGSAYDGIVRQVWEHMVRTAPLARSLAPAFGVLPDEAFTLALLHDVGKLVIFDRLGTLRTELRRDVKLMPTVLPRLLRELHEVLGGAAALRWGLGKAAVSVISNHHRRGEIDPSPHTEVVFVAEKLDLAMVRGEPVNLVRWFEEGRLEADFHAVARVVERLVAPESGGTGA